MIGATAQRLLAVLSLALLLGLGTADFAGAERVPTGGDSAQQGCRALQDRYLAVRSEYANATPERGQQIINEMANIERDWNSLGCGNVWGKIYQSLVVSTEPLVVQPVYGIEVEDLPVLTPTTVDEAVEPTGGVEVAEAAPVSAPIEASIAAPAEEQGVVASEEPVSVAADTETVAPEGEQEVIVVDETAPAPGTEEQP